MKSRNWLVLLLFIIWSGGSTYYYVCKIKGLCQDKVVEAPKKESPKKKEVPKVVEYGPLIYNWNTPKAITNDKWPVVMSEIMSGEAEGKVLRITGDYYSDEENNTSFPNLGKARAEEVKKLFSGKVDPGRIETVGRLTKIGLVKARSNPFDGWKNISWVVNNDFVKEVDGKALIYFPTNSAKEIKNKEILDYLNQLAEQLIAKKDQNVRITGHTDSDGDKGANYKLGLRRAKKIKAKLVAKGVDASRIHATSKGEEMPISSNETNEGKQENRRVEIKVN